MTTMGTHWRSLDSLVATTWKTGYVGLPDRAVRSIMVTIPETAEFTRVS